MPDPTRDLPYASIRLYEPGHGDPIVIDPGLVWYDPQSENERTGTSSLDALGRPLTEWIEGVGRVNRAFCVAQDTRLAHGTSSGGSWEEERHSTGGGRGYRVTQYDASNTVTSWSFTFSTQRHPADPEVAFSVLLPDTPSNWDFATYEPFIRVELGAAYAIQFMKGATYLMRYVAGAWQAVQDLPSPPRGAGYDDAQEIWVWVRVLRGQLCVSLDHGRTYSRYQPEGGAATVPQGSVVLRGRGGSVTFGLHQLKSFAATWDSPAHYLERSRLVSGATFDYSRYDAPAGTSSNASVAYTDLGIPLARQAQYRATLTPAVTTGSLWNWYRSAVLYATEYRIARVVQTIGSTYTAPWDDAITAVRISKPEELSGSSATFTVELDAFAANDLEALRWRKVEIILGYHLSDGTDEIYTAFVGYISGFSAPRGGGEEFSKVAVTFQVANATMRFRRDPWGHWRQLPLGGRTPNDAADEILYWHGLNSSYRTWHAAGALGLLPLGSPEAPCELCNPNELPWETLVRLFQERSLEVGGDDSGVLFTLPKDYVSATVDFELHATPPLADDERNTPSQLGYTVDFRESCTAALVYAKDEAGRFVFASAYDSAAETDIASPRFSPWRETVLKEIPGTVTGGYLVGHAQALAVERFPIDRRVDFTIPVDPRRSRRQRVGVYGFAGNGLPDGTECVLLTLDHTYEKEKGLTALSTTGGMKRLDT